jgi:hypothetical protein
MQRLLEEIRDAQREHLAEYKARSEQALELQRRAAARYERMSRLYKGVVIVGGLVTAALLSLLAHLLIR